MTRLEQITRAGYQVKVQWECEFDNVSIDTTELLAHPTVIQSPLCTRDTLYGDEARPCACTLRRVKARLSSMWM